MKEENERESIYKINIIKPKENGKEKTALNNKNLLKFSSKSPKSRIKRKISNLPKIMQSSYREKKNNYCLNIDKTPKNKAINKSFHRAQTSNNINIPTKSNDNKKEEQKDNITKNENTNHNNNINQNINYNINVNNNNQSNIINILKLAKNIYEKDEHFNKDLASKKLSSKDLSNFVKRSFASSSKLILDPKIISSIRKKNKGEDDISKNKKKSSKSSKFLDRKSVEKKNVINLLKLDKSYNNEDFSSMDSNKDDKNNSYLNNNINNELLNISKIKNKKIKKSKTLKKKKSNRKSDKKQDEIKSKNSIRTIKSNIKASNKSLKLKLKNKHNEETSKLDDNDDNDYNTNKKNKRNFFNFCHFLCCWNSKINDLD